MNATSASFGTVPGKAFDASTPATIATAIAGRIERTRSPRTAPARVCWRTATSATTAFTSIADAM